MTNSEIVQANKNVILDLYLAQNQPITKIAHKLITDLKLNFNYSQIESFRRAVNQFVLNLDLAHAKLLDETTGQLESYADKYAHIIHTGAKMLFFDIETSLANVLGFIDHRNQINVLGENIINSSKIVSWAGQWLFEEPFGDVMTPKEAINGDPRRIVKNLWNALDEADIVVTYNGKTFDVPYANTFFALYGLGQPSQFAHIDMYNVVKKKLYIKPATLDNVCQTYGLPPKIRTTNKLWHDCFFGDQDALNEMFTYNKQDVVILKDLYLYLRPFIGAHPNLAFYLKDVNKLVCPVCGAQTLTKLIKPYTTLLNVFDAFRCDSCNSIGHGRKNTTDSDLKPFIIAPNNR
jgi:uncharacterized protein YprB with RNaseH-like and TPR domain